MAGCHVLAIRSILRGPNKRLAYNVDKLSGFLYSALSYIPGLVHPAYHTALVVFTCDEVAGVK